MDERSIGLRRAILGAFAAGGRGHLGSALSIVEILRVLYDDILRFDPRKPLWEARDRFILSKGHGCLALYCLLAEKGFFPTAELGRFCKRDGLLGGHPERGTPGVEVSTGSLGHGLSIGVGFALAARMDAPPRRVFVLVGDGECNEGSVWEAALCAAKHRLIGLTVIVDHNGQQSYGATRQVQDMEPLADKWRSFGFETRSVDGHDVEVLRRTFRDLPLAADRPSAVVCETVKGKGIPLLEGDASWHHRTRVSEAEVQDLLASLEFGR